jgi:hypothetical protein
LWAAVLFTCNVGVMLFFTLKIIPMTDLPALQQWFPLLIGISLLFLLSALIGSFWLSIVITHAKTIIQTMLWMNIFFQFICTIASLLSGSILMALLFALSTVGSYWYLNAVQPRVNFASAVLGTACSSLRHHLWAMTGVALMGGVLHMLWLGLWIMGSLGIVMSLQSTQQYIQNLSDSNNAKNHNNHNDNGSSLDDDGDIDFPVPGWIIFSLLFSLYWGTQVISYIVHTTVSGSLAWWWFKPDQKSAVKSALFRACTFHFGSICFGALLVAILHTLREIVRAMRNQAKRRSEGRDTRRRSRSEDSSECVNQLFLCLAEMLLGCLESIAR